MLMNVFSIVESCCHVSYNVHATSACWPDVDQSQLVVAEVEYFSMGTKPGVNQ